MRLIDADALKAYMISGLDEMKDFTGTNGLKGYRDMELVTKSFLKDIDEQPTVNEWIPVTERMPEDKENVLVCRTSGDIFIAHHIEIGFITFPEPYLLKDDTVAAWCDLPDPYLPTAEKEADHDSEK